MSQRELAEKVNLSTGFLSQLENDIARKPSEGKLRELATALEVEPDTLILLAGRIPSDVPKILRERPELLGMLRAAAL
jgi:transcriptional regulator with XRE-family HTH domain